jgi:hypothetical protein
MSTLLLPVQQSLQPPLPTIEGNVDYNQFRDQLVRIDQLLIHSGIEERFIARTFEEWKAKVKFKNISPKTQLKIQIHARRALRSTLLRTLIMEDFRGFAIRLADSPLFQWFCGLRELDRIQVPAKSTLQRYSQWTDEATVRELANELNQMCHFHCRKLGLKSKLDLQTYFLDSTCVQSNIHYPVDWVLLRDATRTLMKAVALIRGQGLRHRMEEPHEFIKRMNRLCIQMTHSGAKSDSKKHRKKVFRAMDRLVTQVQKHAKRYRQILDEQWEQTEWTRGEVDFTLSRLDNVIEQLPEARRQGRERIIREQQVPSKDKILSLYEADAQVIVRKKAGAEVEFGNTLFLGETPSGVIIDWELFKEVAPNDAKLVERSLERTEQNLDIHIEAAAGDRGFDSQSNREFLNDRQTYNGICPRDPRQLRERKKSSKFTGLQRRRSQTEGRIGIVKNAFLGAPLRSKGFHNRELAVTWAVLTHNLWVIARLPQRKVAKQPQRKAA